MSEEQRKQLEEDEVAPAAIDVTGRVNFGHSWAR
jgi:hypothetical protein